MQPHQIAFEAISETRREIRLHQNQTQGLGRLVVDPVTLRRVERISGTFDHAIGKSRAVVYFGGKKNA
jgi:hypothetical protein